MRPFAVAAVLRGITFTQVPTSVDTQYLPQASYNSFIDLQEKLHQNICRSVVVFISLNLRKRSLVAIGTHDLDTLQGPFTYDAQPPAEVSFKPLRAPDMVFYVKFADYRPKSILLQSFWLFMRATNSCAHMYHYYVGSPWFLSFEIAAGQCFPCLPSSMVFIFLFACDPWGFHSRITLATKNVFIECTATDQTKVV